MLSIPKTLGEMRSMSTTALWELSTYCHKMASESFIRARINLWARRAEAAEYEISIRPWKACCSRAKLRHCVCLVSYDCKVHGVTCYGTHD